ncbi:MAG: hypothetical protein KDA28_02125, partial [Phycisphaerales bacterium]|nr:hypothetical protein [Phycisphaerales bacterium]
MKHFTLALMMAAGAAFAQPANDDCDFAESIAGFGNFAYDTTDATDSGFPEDNIPADVWFFWTAEMTSTVNVSTCGNATWDTMLAVYSGDCFDAFELDYNDDACALQSEVEFSATAGQTYLIRAGGFDGATGAASLTIAEGGLPYTIIYSEYNPDTDKTYTLVQVDDIQGVQAA